mmetsp:Transcript_56824/g.101720  ORF Transcript_56824/g.101720 Transcript_56824/m.101720 type:complete len:116 (-) Transcript_56824:249-596(-)
MRSGSNLKAEISVSFIRLPDPTLFFLRKCHTRLAIPCEILCSEKNCRILDSSSTFFAFICRMCVIAAVMLLTNEENATSARIITTITKKRSNAFCGTTSMEAGVNCVNDQCKEVA